MLQSDLMLLLARTTPYDELKDKTKGLSVFIVDLREAKGELEVKPLDLMINHHTTSALFFDGVEVPAENLVGQEGLGFRYIIDGWNAERILVAAEAIGDGRWFTERAAKYASERIVFGRPIGSNQGIQFPIAQAYARIEAADLVRYQAATKFDRNEKCGAEANMAKLLASEAAWEAANACLTTHGGYGFARGVRCRAQVPRDAASHCRSGQQQFSVGLSWPACFGNAEIVLREDQDTVGRVKLIVGIGDSMGHLIDERFVARL